MKRKSKPGWIMPNKPGNKFWNEMQHGIDQISIAADAAVLGQFKLND